MSLVQSIGSVWRVVDQVHALVGKSEPCVSRCKLFSRVGIAFSVLFWVHGFAHAETHAENASLGQRESASINQIDELVARQLREAGLQANPPADRATLIRRVSFDLTGLPPTPDQVAAFVADRAPDAYERLVERLLASPRYGERMAQFWLDLARYADSDGYHDDTNRAMWPYRDYVIRSFNSAKPFDEFTIEQLAGDLLPNATLEQQVATAFHRNAPTSSEDGANPEEYRARYAVDRVNTTSQVWLGLTVQCAECHDHKYDPISIKEYYQLFAFFNQSPEEPLFRGLYAPPSIAVPNESEVLALNDLDARIKLAKERVQALASSSSEEFKAWRDSLNDDDPVQIPREAVACEYLFEEPLESNSPDTVANTGSRRRNARLATASLGGELPMRADGPFGKCLQLSGNAYLDLGRVFEVRPALPFTIETWFKSDGSAEACGPLFSTVDYDNESRGFELRLVKNRIVIRLVDSWPEAAIEVATVGRIEPNSWTHLSVTFDGRLSADALYVYVNGRSQDLSVDRQAPIATIRNRSSFLVGGDAKIGFRGALDEVRLFNWPLPSSALAQLPRNGLTALRKNSRQENLRHYFHSAVNPRAVAARDRLFALERERQLFQQKLPRVRIMRDRKKYRPTRVLLRGDFRDQGEVVEAQTPEMLPALSPLDANRERYDRLDLAKWLVRENRQHTAAVLANRLWALYFHRGIVSTLDDFGVMGAEATNPELLNWLRNQLLATNWDVKALIRAIVLSAVYRQDSGGNADAWANDPHNELLARGPRRRMPAEMIRDNALAVSGLLSSRIGGPSVRPYQPAGLWREMAKGDEVAKQYQQSHGESLYRRGIYTFWKRSIHYPSFSVFDAPSREVCTSSRPVTNTPSQALTLLNDPVFVEAARVFACRIVAHATDFDSRLHFAFRTVLAREPKHREVEALRKTQDTILLEFEANPLAARQLIAIGEYSPGVLSRGVTDVELATWTSLAQILLTSDEAISTN